MALSKGQIWNMALAECPADRIDTTDDGSFEAETCATHYQPALEFLLEDHDWDFATKRIELAEITNDRPDEWGYAYALPADMARPRHVLPGTSAAIVGMVTTPTRYWGRLASYEGAVDHRIAQGVLYAGISGAVLEYITNDPSEAVFTGKFARALALLLASRIVMPIKKDTKRQGELIRMAEIERERAKAADMNRDPESTFDFTPEVQMAKVGGLPGLRRY